MTPDPSFPGRRPAPELVVIFTGGDPLAADAAGVPDLRIDDAAAGVYVIAADSGLHHALAMGQRVDLLIGDLDSVSAAALAAAEAAGVEVERHPVGKDRTDLELALDRALETGTSRVVVVGGHGGRIDHFVANTLLLAAPRYAGLTLEARLGETRVHVVRRSVEVPGVAGEVVTLLPLGGRATGVTTRGLRYPLDGEPLLPGSTRGVSNELVSPPAEVRLADGVLLVIVPGTRSSPVDESNDQPQEER